MSSLRQQALKLLARREHSRAELAQKLAASAGKEEILIVLDQLEETGLISDRRTAEAYLRSHAQRLGAARLRQDLRAKGIAAELIDECLGTEAEAPLASEEERALQVWQKKFGQAAEDARDWARQARFLQARGFSSATIRKVLKSAGEES